MVHSASRAALALAVSLSFAAFGCGGGSGGGGSAVVVRGAPRITSTPPATAGVGVLYTYTPAATGRPAPSIAASNLPAWLGFQGGVLSGTPASSDLGVSSPITIRATNGVSPSAVQTFTIDVLAVAGQPVSPAITTAAPTTATEGTRYSYVAAATGNPPPAFTATGLPGWLGFDGATRTLSGTPGAADVGVTGPITIVAANGFPPDATETFSITVSSAPSAPQFTSTPPAGAREGQLYSYTASATGNPAPALSASGLPAWLAFDPATGLLEGTPGAAQVGTNPTVTIVAANGVAPQATQQFTIAVVSASATPPQITSTAPHVATDGEVFAYPVDVTGTPTPVLSATGLPAWLSFDPVGQIFVGVPATANVGTTSTIVLTASNGAPPNAVQTFDLFVDPVALAKFDFAGAMGTEPTWDASVVHQSLVAPVTVRRGAGIEATSANNSFGARAWTGAAAPDPADYFTFTVAPAAGSRMTLQRIRIDERRSLTGIREWSIRSSLDGFAADLGVFPVPDDDLRRWDETIVLPPAFAALRGAVEFRIYGYKSETQFGTWRLLTIRTIGVMAPTTATGQAPAIASAAPTVAQEAQQLSYTIATTGSPTPTITVAGLPAWLAYTTATRTIAGMPTAADVGRTGQITITAANGINPNATQAFTIDVQGLSAPSFLRLPTATATAGYVYASTITVGGNPAPTVTVTGLPGWLSYDPATRTLTGVPGAGDVGTTGPITITAANGIPPDAVQTFTIAVRAPQTAAGLVVFDTSGAAGNEQALAATLIAANLQTPIELRRGTGLLAQNGGGALNSSRFTTQTALDPNGHLKLAVGPASGFQTTLTSLVFNHRRSGSGPHDFAVRSSLDGFAADLATFQVNDTADHADETVALGAAFANLATPVELRIYGFHADQSGGTWRVSNIRVRGSVANIAGNTAPQITSAALTAATEGTLYRYALTATGNPAPTLAATGLPASGWLSFDAVTGVLSGTPGTGDVGNTGTITITASNGIIPNASQQISIAVAPAAGGAAPAITSTPLGTATVGARYAYTVVATGSPAPTLAASGLPASGWLTFDAATGVLSGTPGAGDVGTTGTITIAAANGVPPDASQGFTIAVSAAPSGGVDLVVFDTTGKAGSEATVGATRVDSSLQSPVTLSRGAGLVANVGSNSFNSKDWALGAAIGTTDFVSFTVAPATGFRMTLTSFNFDHQRSSTGAQSFEVRTSLDGFAQAIATFDVPVTTPITGKSITFGPAFASLAGPVEVRLYGFSASGGNGTWRVQNLHVVGSTFVSP